MAVTTADTIRLSDVCLEFYGNSSTSGRTLTALISFANTNNAWNATYENGKDSLLDFRGAEYLRYFTLASTANNIGEPYIQEDTIELEVTVTNDGTNTDTQNIDGWWQKSDGSGGWDNIEPAGPISYGPLAADASTTKSFYYTSSIGDSGDWRLNLAAQYGTTSTLTYTFEIL